MEGATRDGRTVGYYTASVASGRDDYCTGKGEAPGGQRQDHAEDARNIKPRGHGRASGAQQFWALFEPSERIAIHALLLQPVSSTRA